MYCRTCAQSLDENAVACTKCGCAPGSGQGFCWSCGKPVHPQGVACVSCGASLSAGLGHSAKLGNAKPGKVTAMAILTLVSAIINFLLAFMFILTCYGIIIAPLFLVTAIFELLEALKLLPDPIRTNKPTMAVPILEICTIIGCNVIGVTAGILNLVFQNDPEVKAYYQAQRPS